MRPNRLTVPQPPDASFHLRHEQSAYFTNPWHFHPELELNYIVAGTGTRFIGQSVARFGPGEILLLGSNVPHYWKSDPVHYQPNSSLLSEAIVVRFRPDFAGDSFFTLPETRAIQGLLDRAVVGLQVNEPMVASVAETLWALTEQSGFSQLMAFLTLLHELAHSTALVAVSPGYVSAQQWQKQSERMSKVIAYLHDHFTEPISLEQVAGIANMNPASFCRYFRQQTGYTLGRFVTDLRVRYAAELLISTSLSVTEVGERVGFDNVSHFVQTFRRCQQQTPFVFRQQLNRTTPYLPKLKSREGVRAEASNVFR
ncbi:helix-turn-helix domain-containing protein [Spirosoma montaniterrae]|uniref:HTH araC/xylS-type domain-containing protein n=1 Tax=Spirosoma montaniterrae TaxID=1178516 RepID=A0A1P9WRK6_9BACT|nr:AraC family transcriptional regulator [Spirosoma montaniterrae]AQG78007.1 hypothetical protein AWR27_00755 [Spirosoma montaniterrae]